MALTFRLDLDSVSLNLHGLQIITFKVIVRTWTHTHTGLIALPRPLTTTLLLHPFNGVFFQDNLDKPAPER